MSTNPTPATTRTGPTVELFQATIARILPDPDQGQRQVISFYSRKLLDLVDIRRHALTGAEAVNCETLSATATVLFGAALAKLGFYPEAIAEHGALFGVAVRGIIVSS